VGILPAPRPYESLQQNSVASKDRFVAFAIVTVLFSSEADTDAIIKSAAKSILCIIIVNFYILSFMYIF